MIRSLLWTVTTALTFLLAPGSALGLLEEEKQATFLKALVGKYAVFNCHLDFPQDIVIPHVLRWNKEGKIVFSFYEGVLTATEAYAGRISSLGSTSNFGKGSVNLTGIRETDSGWYECSVFFLNRTPSTRPNGTWFHLQVDGGTLLSTPPINQTTLEGLPAKFPCVTKDSDAKVTWRKDGVPVTQLSDLSQRSWIGADGTLTIDTTDMEDPGEYLCEVTNSMGDRQEASAFLNVQYKAKVTYSPPQVFLPYGRPGIVDCHFRSNPPLTQLRWEKDGLLFDPYNVPGVYYKPNGSLYFIKVDETHGGRYTCMPINELGSAGRSNAMQVVIQKAPVFTVTPHNLYLRKTGETLEMPCDAIDGEQSHRPTIVWFRKDGATLPQDRTTIRNGNLSIENIRESDRGLYQCVASNEAATISSETELIIENATPRAPYNLTATSSTTAVTLHWTPGFTRPNMEYSIWYRSADTQEWRTMKILSRGATQATVNNLNPGRHYEFMVLSQDKQGDGMFSKALQIKTKGTAQQNGSAQEFKSPIGSFQQIGPPRNVTVELMGEGYMVTWDPPEFGGNELKMYTVMWSRGPREQMFGRADTTDTSYLVKNLEEDTTYYFQVTALSTNDYTAESSNFIIHVPGYRQLRAVGLGVAVGVAFLAVAALGSWYIRKLYLNKVARADKEDEY